jgi:hypothetical protein
MARRFQVIQGGKDKKKGSRDESPRLFRAFSIGDFAKKEMIYSEVRFNWYCLDRIHAHIEYGMAIADYENLGDRERRYFERTVDRYFSDPEIRLLSEYLNTTFGYGLEVEEVYLPIRERQFLFEEGSSVIYDFLELSNRSGYDLSFKVWGYYTLAHSLASPSMEDGIRLLRKSFELLRLTPTPPTSDEELRRALSRIYREDGLYVKNRDDLP